MFAPRDVIRQVGMGLAVGEKVRIVCPFCNANHEKSCAISVKTDGIFFVCPRAKCKEAGVINTVGAAMKELTKRFVPRHYYGSFRHLPEHIEAYLEFKYSITKDVHNRGRHRHISSMRYDDITNRLVIPVPGMLTRGMVGYYAKKLPLELADMSMLDVELYNSQQKGDIYRYKDELFVYPSDGLEVSRSDVVCLVEDALSAIKLGTYVPTIALMSTALPNDLLKHLKNVKHLVIALDPDATHIAKAMQRKIGILFDKVSIVTLDADPKDTLLVELERVIQELL